MMPKVGAPPASPTAAQVGTPPSAAETGAAAATARVGAPDTRPTQAPDGFGATGPRGFLALDQKAAEQAAKATVTNARALLERAGEGLERIEPGAPLAGAQAERAASVLAQLEKVHRDLSTPGLGSAAADAGFGADVRGLRAELAQSFATLVERAESAKAGPDLARARVLGEAFMRLSEPILGPRAPALDVGVVPALALPAGVQTIAERAALAYDHTARAPTHFSRVAMYGPHLRQDLAKLSELEPKDPATRAYVETLEGLTTMLVGGYPDAVAHFEKALRRLGGEDASIEFNLARAHARNDKPAKALDALEDAVKHATTPAQAQALRELAAADPAMTALLGEPGYHAIVESVGGTRLTRMEGVRDHRDRPLHRTEPRMYHVGGAAERQDFDAIFAPIRASAYEAKRTNVNLVWNESGVGSLVAERVPMNGVVSDVDLATFTQVPKEGRWEIAVHGHDRLVFDPAELHRLLGELKLRDHAL
jgi:tetratricopeptide (TPR) repeat protein